MQPKNNDRRRDLADFARLLRSHGIGRSGVRERNRAARAMMRRYADFLELVDGQNSADRAKAA